MEKTNEFNIELGKLKLDKNVNTYALVESLKQGIGDLMNSQTYKKYLDFCSKLYNYSNNNKLLIFFQNPDASYVGSFTFWKANKRYVNRGEKGIMILAPVTKKEMEIVSEKRPDGTIKEVEQEVLKIVSFKPTYVFDISQTSGEPIPTILKKLSGKSNESELLIDGIKNICKLPIIEDNQNRLGNANGAFDPKNNEILYSPKISLNQLAKTLIHEYTHSKLHDKIDDYVINRDRYEIEAESAAYMVCKHFGLDTSDYSFGYITSWATGKEIKDYEDSLKLSSDVSKQIINELNGYFEHLLVKQKQHIKAELNKNHFKDNEKLIDNIHKLYIITNSSSLKDIKELCTKDIPEETRSLLSSVTDELKKQEFKLMSQQPSR